jgi:hypothetical protein
LFLITIVLGPIPIPLIGNLIQVGAAHPVPFLALAELSKRYGDVFQIRIGYIDTGKIETLSFYENAKLDVTSISK